MREQLVKLGVKVQGAGMAELPEEQMEDMAATMRLPPEQRSVGQVGALMDLVAGQQFFQSLSFKLAQQVCKHLRPLHIETGDYVFKEGDDGWEFYVILSGTAEVIISGATIATMGVGTTFGELALIDGDIGNSKRTASIRCATDCFFGVVGKDVYNRLIKKEQEAALSLVIDFYSRNQYLQEMRADAILHMAHVSHSKRWAKGDTIMATGEAVDGVIFLKSGQCMISKDIYVAPDSAIRGPMAASLSNSGHPGLRQDHKRICVDISLVCGYGDVVGESELLAEVLTELATSGSGADSRKRGASDKVDKEKAETHLTRTFTVKAVTDVEAFHVKSRDAKRFITRSLAAREALKRNQARRDSIFAQRMAQWEAAQKMQHSSQNRSGMRVDGGGTAALTTAVQARSMGSSSAKPAGRAVLAPFPESSALHRSRSGRESSVAGSGVQQIPRTLLSMGTMNSGGGAASASSATSPSLPPVVRTSELPARARSTSPSRALSTGRSELSAQQMRSSNVLRSRAAGGKERRNTSRSRTRSPLWAPKYSVAQSIDIAKKSPVAFGRQGRRFPMTVDEKQKEREGDHGGDLQDQIVWRATRGRPAQLRGASPALDEWFEDVAYINSEGVLCA